MFDPAQINERSIGLLAEKMRDPMRRRQAAMMLAQQIGPSPDQQGGGRGDMASLMQPAQRQPQVAAGAVPPPQKAPMPPAPPQQPMPQQQMPQQRLPPQPVRTSGGAAEQYLNFPM